MAVETHDLNIISFTGLWRPSEVGASYKEESPDPLTGGIVVVFQASSEVYQSGLSGQPEIPYGSTDETTVTQSSSDQPQVPVRRQLQLLTFDPPPICS